MLVAGKHRLEVVKALEFEFVECRVVDWTERTARRWEISENLHRAELTTLQRTEQIAEWIRITEEEAKELQSAQSAPIESRRADGRGHRRSAGINAASRELGIERTEAQRANKIARITPAAKEAVRAAGLDDNQTALLKVAAADEADQVAAVEAIVAERSAPEPEVTFATWIEEGRRWLARGTPEFRALARDALF